ncbi:MAG TPA: CrcB family protein [Planctomycetaceae bacterium]|jgi:CrcB protein|nr:CrcB family protein [Planctomycetaceae bacterium]
MRNLAQQVSTFIAIGFAASMGAMLRYGVATVCGRFVATKFPVGTFLINMSASLFLGWFLTFIEHRVSVSDTTRLAVAVGFVGTYSTFSTFAYESNALLGEGLGIKALVYMVGSVVGGLIAVRLGVALARA